MPTQDRVLDHGHLGKEKVCWLVPLPWPYLSGIHVRNDVLGMSPGEVIISPLLTVCHNLPELSFTRELKEAGKPHIYSNVFILI